MFALPKPQNEIAAMALSCALRRLDAVTCGVSCDGVTLSTSHVRSESRNLLEGATCDGLLSSV